MGLLSMRFAEAKQNKSNSITFPWESWGKKVNKMSLRLINEVKLKSTSRYEKEALAFENGP